MFLTNQRLGQLVNRREFSVFTGFAAAISMIPACAVIGGKTLMYGLIGKMIAAPGKRDELISILLEGTTDMPGCLSYVVSQDSKDENALWVTEVWESRASHEASLSLPGVQRAIAKGKPMITAFGERFETTPVGGHGLA